MPAARLTLLCHAATAALRTATFDGGADGLDASGRRQATALRGRLPPADRIWTSPARAAVETADALDLPAAVDPRLRDVDFGRWTGLRFQQVLFREPRRLVRWMRDPGSAPHGGESLMQLLARVADWMGDPGRHRGHVIAVTHSAVARAAVVHALGADPPSFWRIDMSPTSYADLRTNGRRWVLRGVVPPSGANGDG